MEIPTAIGTESTLSHQISFQRGSKRTTLLLIKQCLRELETNHLEMSPNTTPRIQAMPGKAANLATEQGPLPATKLQGLSPPYLAQQSLLRSSTSQSAPLGLQQKSWEFSSEVPTLLGSPAHKCSHLSHYMSRSSLGGSRKRGQVR